MSFIIAWVNFSNFLRLFYVLCPAIIIIIIRDKSMSEQLKSLI